MRTYWEAPMSHCEACVHVSAARLGFNEAQMSRALQYAREIEAGDVGSISKLMQLTAMVAGGEPSEVAGASY